MRFSLLSTAFLSLFLPHDVSADTKIVSACSSSLSDVNPPVLKSLRSVIGDSYANQFMGLLGSSSVRQFLISSAGSSCLANMNGSSLGEVLISSSSVDSCASALEMFNLPLVQAVIGNLSLSNTSSDAFIEDLGLVKEQEIDQICSLYVDGFVPCLRSQLLPSLATLRTTASNGCCAAWESESVSLFDYTLTGQYTKMAQLIGDVFCATQTPAFNGTSSQRCGFTLLQSSGEFANTTSAERAASLLKDLQIPTDQACLKAEGETYKDTDGNPVAAMTSDQYSTSGCVVALDRLATWINDLPLAINSSNSYGIDLQSLFGTGTCTKGGNVFSAIIQHFVPISIVEVMKQYFSTACLHVPIQYADGCSFSRPASLVDWNYEPKHASQAGSQKNEDSNSAINSLNTVPPHVTSDSSAAITVSKDSVVITTTTLTLSLLLVILL